MAWFKVDDGFANSKPVLRIPRRYRSQAVGLWTLAGTWSAKEETDGFIPEYVLEELCGTAGIAQQLVKCGLWENVSGSYSDPVGIVPGSYSDPDLAGWRFRNWGRYQPTKSEMEEKREKERIRKAEYRMSQRDAKGTGSGQTVGHQRESDPPDPTRPDPTTSKDVDTPPREEIIHLCTVMADCVEGNGAKRPTITKAATEATRKLLDVDGYTPHQVEWMIRWATSHEFWRSNILSMSKLRDKFDQLKLQSMEGKHRVSMNGDVNVTAVLGEDYWQPGTPPPGLSIQEEIEWKKKQRAEHEAARLAEAKMKVGA